MPKLVSSTEAKTRFGELLKWAEEHNDDVIVKLYGEPKAVIMSYAEYEEVSRLRQREERWKAWEALEGIRKRVRAQNLDLTEEEAYRRAGFSEDVIQETLKNDRQPAEVGEV